VDIAQQQLDIGRRAAEGERAEALAAECGVNARTIARWRAKWRALQESGGAPTADTRTEVGEGRTGQATGQGQATSPTPHDAPRARARGPIASRISRIMAGMTKLLEHEVDVLVARAAASPGEPVLTDAEQSRAMSGMCRALRDIAAVAPELLVQGGEVSPEVAAVAAESDPTRRAEMLRDIALARGQVPAAIAAEKLAGDDTLHVVLTAEGQAAVDGMAE